MKTFLLYLVSTWMGRLILLTFLIISFATIYNITQSDIIYDILLGFLGIAVLGGLILTGIGFWNAISSLFKKK